VNAPMRRGACPALSTPMPTGDGLLIRLSPASGGLSPKQLIGLCEAAARHGNGIVEVSARGSFQFRGFLSDSARGFADDVDQLGIDVRVGVSVETSPLGGMDLQEISNPLPLAEAIRQRISEAGLAARLGPKVSVIVDGGGQVSLDSIASDVRLVAVPSSNSVFWTVAIAGNGATAKAVGVFDEAAAVAVALRTLTGIADLGRDGRAKDLREIRSVAPPSVLPDISPARGEISSGTPGGRTDGGATERNSTTTSLSAFALTGNRYALPISLPFGHCEAANLIDLVRSAEALGVTDIRPAPQRRLLFICATADIAETLRESAQSLGFITSPSDPRHSIAACPGSPACASGKIPAREVAAQLADVLGKQSGLSIHISGCEKGCARQTTADITIVGDENGARLVVGGTTKAAPLAYTSTKELPRAIAGAAMYVDAIRARNGTAALSQSDEAGVAAAFEQG
jgi:precorrin-3B synthase